MDYHQKGLESIVGPTPKRIDSPLYVVEATDGHSPRCRCGWIGTTYPPGLKALADQAAQLHYCGWTVAYGWQVTVGLVHGLVFKADAAVEECASLQRSLYAARGVATHATDEVRALRVANEELQRRLDKRKRRSAGRR